MEGLQDFGSGLIQALQTLSPALDLVMKAFSFLGIIEFYMLFITFLYWVINRQWGIRIFLLLIGTDFVGSAFKHIFHQPRPYWVNEGIKPLSIEPSYGVPSTHASDSLAVWGYLAYCIKQSWGWILSIIIIVMIGISRLYLGVHFPHDVLVGWIIGGVSLWLFIRYEDRVSAWFAAKSMAYQLGIGLLLSVLIIAAGLIIVAWIAASPDPIAWVSFAEGARSPTHYFTLAGALFGAISGYVLMIRYARFATGGTWLRKAGRYLLGILGVVVVLYGLDVVFSLIAGDETMLGYLLRYIRYGSTTFWAMFAAPWLFLKLRLADPENPS